MTDTNALTTKNSKTLDKIRATQQAVGFRPEEDSEEQGQGGGGYSKLAHKAGAIRTARSHETKFSFTPLYKPGDEIPSEVEKLFIKSGDRFLPLGDCIRITGIVVEHRIKPGARYYDLENNKVTVYCEGVGHQTFDQETGQEVYLKQDPTLAVPSMYEFEDKFTGTKPHKALPANFYGKQGQCRSCIANGNSVFQHEGKDGKVIQVPCNLRGWVYIYVKALASVTTLKQDANGQPIIPKTSAIRPEQVEKVEIRDKGKVISTTYQGVEVFPMDSVYNEEGEPIGPFILGLQQTSSAYRGAWNSGIMSYYHLTKAMAEVREPNPTFWQASVTLRVKETAINKSMAIPHWEAFDSQGLSVYAPKRPDPRNPGREIGCQAQPLTTLGADLIPHFRLNDDNDYQLLEDALSAWLEAREEVDVSTFDPESLKPIARGAQVISNLGGNATNIEQPVWTAPVTAEETGGYFQEIS